MTGTFLASVHQDYLPFISVASDTELAQFIRAQICLAIGEPIPELAGIAKALLETHLALIERLEADKEPMHLKGATING